MSHRLGTPNRAGKREFRPPAEEARRYPRTFDAAPVARGIGNLPVHSPATDRQVRV
ncbi:hypothetical protein ACFWWM_10220 [Streptomyces sp. NPDC058682]|uniref:hypothetical protein n=1 Tax=Streptomyces sp. NPDC058682 TaxID=3346596 RepID=UPI00364EFD94